MAADRENEEEAGIPPEGEMTEVILLVSAPRCKPSTTTEMQFRDRSRRQEQEQLALGGNRRSKSEYGSDRAAKT
jgi:hypothetical protein